MKKIILPQLRIDFLKTFIENLFVISKNIKILTMLQKTVIVKI